MNSAAPEREGNLDLAVIGNSRIAALVDQRARIVWWCFPRFDSNPIFSRLLAGDDEKGFCEVALADLYEARSQYVRNTALVETILTDSRGAKVRVTDFAPRFERYGRIFRPPQLIRRIEPIAGLPRIAIKVRPTYDYGRPVEEVAVGSNHIRYIGDGEVMRLTTDAPLSYVVAETSFALTRPVSLILGQDDPFPAAIDGTCREFVELTGEHWREWVRHLGVPFEWQSAVIRAAITLKLCNYEETGAIVAALTTSIPEAPRTPRTWDYRYCWLRDAFFVVDALNRLGATHTMESYINYITTVAVEGRENMQPVQGVVPFTALDEVVAPNLKGYFGHGPVRIGNQAAGQLQHDAYGSVVLGAKQMFVDERLPKMGDPALFSQLEALGERARKFAFEPDAGIWEYRGRKRVHTYSAALCWAACDRLGQIARRLDLQERAQYWARSASAIASRILAEAWSESRGAFTGALGQPDLDASVLLLARLGLVSPSDERFRRTCETIGRELMRNGRIMRYAVEDDFGAPETAFLACNFWYADALAAVGRRDEARERFESILSCRNSFGLLSEDVHPETGELWGNFPQAYSMAGIINTATRLSLSWQEAWTCA
ncbi:MAG: glycoside hydrolase family 15 protein [Roseiarcus sp.]